MVHDLFGFICHQSPTHSWSFGGDFLPLCQRCTGLYVGAAIALALHVLLRPRPTARFLWVHSFFLLQMIPNGLYWIPQTPLLRLTSGLLFGHGVVAYLWLVGGATTTRVRGPSSIRYFLMVAAGLVAIPTLVGLAPPLTGELLIGVSFLGLIGLAELILAGLWRLFSRCPSSTTNPANPQSPSRTRSTRARE